MNNLLFPLILIFVLIPLGTNANDFILAYEDTDEKRYIDKNFVVGESGNYIIIALDHNISQEAIDFDTEIFNDGQESVIIKIDLMIISKNFESFKMVRSTLHDANAQIIKRINHPNEIGWIPILEGSNAEIYKNALLKLLKK